MPAEAVAHAEIQANRAKGNPWVNMQVRTMLLLLLLLLLLLFVLLLRLPLRLLLLPPLLLMLLPAGDGGAQGEGQEGR